MILEFPRVSGTLFLSGLPWGVRHPVSTSIVDQAWLRRIGGTFLLSNYTRLHRHHDIEISRSQSKALGGNGYVIPGEI